MTMTAPTSPLPLLDSLPPTSCQSWSLGVATGSPPFFSARLDELKAKVARGERLSNAERAERQGIIFNHSGKPSGFTVI